MSGTAPETTVATVQNAMNTIPSTFNRDFPPYTVIGGARRNAATGLCAVLLNRGGRYARGACFKELENSGFDYVLSMESGEHFDIEELKDVFPFVRFILFKDAPNTGVQINVAAAEADTPLFFMLWGDFHPILSLDAERIAERLLIKPYDAARMPAEKMPAARMPAEKNTDAKSPYARLCTTPTLQNSAFEVLPVACAPLIKGRKFETLPFAPVKEAAPTLYPFNAAGVYDRERFIGLGGFDPALNSPYWQFLDFGLRAWLWGEEIRCTQQIRFSLDEDTPAENSTADESYLRFFLKNLAPVIQAPGTEVPAKDGKTAAASAHLPLRCFLPYLLNTACGPVSAARNFSEIRRWVSANSRRFVNDINGIMPFWNQPAPP
ncbi:MAG: hypothetical protein LBD86_03665 [Spirochaetaceae bacterium]|jgi:hypothetical protein|nr:hypothetical protein [Spirochaetaceae bacterium]